MFGADFKHSQQLKLRAKNGSVTLPGSFAGIILNAATVRISLLFVFSYRLDVELHICAQIPVQFWYIFSKLKCCNEHNALRLCPNKKVILQPKMNRECSYSLGQDKCAKLPPRIQSSSRMRVRWRQFHCLQETADLLGSRSTVSTQGSGLRNSQTAVES